MGIAADLTLISTQVTNISTWEHTPSVNPEFLCSPPVGSTVEVAHSAAHQDPVII